MQDVVTGPSVRHIFLYWCLAHPSAPLLYVWFIIQFPLDKEVKVKHALNSDLYYHYFVLKLISKSNVIDIVPFKITLVIEAVAAALQYQACHVTFWARRAGRVLKLPLLPTLSCKKVLCLLFHLLRQHTVLFSFQLSEGLKTCTAAYAYFYSVWDEQHIFIFAAWLYVPTYYLC